jgi:hypothetical protein
VKSSQLQAEMKGDPNLSNKSATLGLYFNWETEFRGKCERNGTVILKIRKLEEIK